MFRPMRRWKQQLSDEDCIAILKNEPRGSYLYWAMTGILTAFHEPLVLRGRRQAVFPRSENRSQDRCHFPMRQGFLLCP